LPIGVGLTKLAALAFVLGVTCAYADPPFIVVPPCGGDGNSWGFRNCQRVLNAPIPPTTAAARTWEHGGILPHLRDDFKRCIVPGLYYKQLPPDPQGRKCALPLKPLPVGPTFCSLQANFLNPVSEKTQNRVPNSCGAPVHIRIKRVGHTGVAVFERNATYPGTLEDGYLRGAVVPAISYHLKRVIDEISAMKLEVHADCNVLALAYNNGRDKLKEDVALQGDDAFRVVVIQHMREWTHPDENGAEELSVKVNQLVAARGNLESAFMDMAICEAASRAQSDHEQKLGSYEARSSTLARVRTDALEACKNVSSSSSCDTNLTACIQTCIDDCNQKAQHVPPIPCDEPACEEGCYDGAEVCIKATTNDPNACYQQNLPGIIQKIIDEKWPVIDPPANDSFLRIPELPRERTFAGWLLVGSLFGPLGPRPRPLRGRRRALRAFLIALTFLVVATVFGCKGSDIKSWEYDPGPNACPAGLGGYPSSCCPDGYNLSPDCGGAYCTDPECNLSGQISVKIISGTENWTIARVDSIQGGEDRKSVV
jgi:hypothetical protein